MNDDDDQFPDPDTGVDPVDGPDTETEAEAEAAAEETPSRGRAAAAGAPAAKPKRQRTSPRQFLREVRSELRKVAWPSRKELFSYSLVVLVSVSLITAYIAGLDQLFGTLILRIFSS